METGGRGAPGPQPAPAQRALAHPSHPIALPGRAPLLWHSLFSFHRSWCTVGASGCPLALRSLVSPSPSHPQKDPPLSLLEFLLLLCLRPSV